MQARLIDDVLDLARVITGKLSLSTTAVQLSTVIEQSIDSLRLEGEEKGVTLALVIEPDTGFVDGDPLRLHQIATNLVSNGIKFTPAGGRVDVRLARHGQVIRMTVTDSGRGITRDLLPHVFERFRQQEDEHGGPRGLGLGLAIVKHLVELHGGTVTAESRGEGLGATFTVELPAIVNN